MSPSDQTRESDVRPLVETLRTKLTADDDPKFWEAALSVLTDEFLQQFQQKKKNRPRILLVGACSHWIRPHQARWTAAGGFAYPQGYANSLPEFDWSVILSYEDKRWIPLRTLPRKKAIILRAALPTRTARHKQAAVYSKWSISEQPVMYGFRNVDGLWKCLACSDQRQHGSIASAEFDRLVKPEDMTHP